MALSQGLAFQNRDPLKKFYFSTGFLNISNYENLFEIFLKK